MLKKILNKKIICSIKLKKLHVQNKLIYMFEKKFTCLKK